MNTAAGIMFGLLFSPALFASEPVRPSFKDFNGAPHFYKSAKPTDRFSRLMEKIESDPRLDRSSEKAFLASLLKILKIPASSQTLVFSTTSLQLRFISPSNPRAIYFNEDIYIGYIPGGRIEAVGIDPTLGAVFYIFDIPRQAGPIRFERSDRCMNCHAGEDTGFVPGLVIKSVVPGPTGGTLDAFRTGKSGHEIPLSDRFGGWHVTGLNSTNHWGNLTGRYVGGNIQTYPNRPGERFDFSRYPVGTSDILAHLLHEHQAGFVNRAVEAGYRVRTALHLANGEVDDAAAKEIDDQARILTRYILFKDEAALPAGGIQSDPVYRKEFVETARRSPDGNSLKDLDLNSRLFKHRCSYMIYSAAFEGLPEVFKKKVFEQLKGGLTRNDPEFAYLDSSEKAVIRNILKATLRELPADW